MVDGGADLRPVVAPWRLGAAAGSGAAAGRDRGRDGVPRRNQHPVAPQGRRRGQKGGSSEQRDEREALGRSRGGYGTKACVIADAAGRAIGFALAPGQAHELPLAPLLLTILSIIPAWIVADRGYASQAFRDLIWISAHGQRFRPSAMRRLWPVRRGSTPIGTASSVSGPGSKSGVRPQRDMRKPPAASWACSAWPPPWTGSSSRTALRDSQALVMAGGAAL